MSTRGHRPGGVVRVEGREDEVARERRVDRDRRRPPVPDLPTMITSVLADDRPQPRREGDACFGVQRNWLTRELVFDRVFDRDDVLLRGVGSRMDNVNGSLPAPVGPVTG
jgi:hypothetical protein